MLRNNPRLNHVGVITAQVKCLFAVKKLYGTRGGILVNITASHTSLEEVLDVGKSSLCAGWVTASFLYNGHNLKSTLPWRTESNEWEMRIKSKWWIKPSNSATSAWVTDIHLKPKKLLTISCYTLSGIIFSINQWVHWSIKCQKMGKNVNLSCSQFPKWRLIMFWFVHNLTIFSFLP